MMLTGLFLPGTWSRTSASRLPGRFCRKVPRTSSAQCKESDLSKLIMPSMSLIPVCEELEKHGASLSKHAEKMRQSGASGRWSQNVERDTMRLLTRGALKTAAWLNTYTYVCILYIYTHTHIQYMPIYPHGMFED